MVKCRTCDDFRSSELISEDLLCCLVSANPLAIAKGDIEGSETFLLFGKNPDIDIATAPEDIWNGGNPYTGFPTGAAETMEIFSSDAADTIAGTGARTVKIQNLLDGAGSKLPDVEIELNGVTPVSLGAQTYYRGGTVIDVLTAGTTGANEGTLTLRHTTTTTNIFAVMPIGNNHTAILCYTVPIGFTLYIDRVKVQMARINGSAGAATISLRSRVPGGVFVGTVPSEITNSQGFTFENNGYFKFEELEDIKVTCDAVTDNNTTISGDMGGILIAN